jgi:hypothetical protein
MLTIALLFFTTSTVGFTSAQDNAPSQFEYTGVCQIAEYAGIDFARQCTGQYIYVRNAPRFAVAVGGTINGVKTYLSFVGEKEKALYADEGDGLPRLIVVSTVSIGQTTVQVNSKSSFCLIAATRSLEGQLVRCYVHGLDEKIYQLLFYTPKK